MKQPSPFVSVSPFGLQKVARFLLHHLRPLPTAMCSLFSKEPPFSFDWRSELALTAAVVALGFPGERDLRDMLDDGEADEVS